MITRIKRSPVCSSCVRISSCVCGRAFVEAIASSASGRGQLLINRRDGIDDLPILRLDIYIDFPEFEFEKSKIAGSSTHESWSPARGLSIGLAAANDNDAILPSKNGFYIKLPAKPRMLSSENKCNPLKQIRRTMSQLEGMNPKDGSAPGSSL